MTQEEKARAFELIASGQVRGMSKFWENYDKLRGLPDNEVLEKMAAFACQEAAEQCVEQTQNQRCSH